MPRPSTDAESSVTPRRRRFWFDPRFAIGLVLVAASVAGVYGVVAASDSTVLVFAARTSLNPGDRVDVDDLIATSIRFDGASRLYLRGEDVPPDGFIVNRSVAAGELLPASAVGNVAGERLASIVVEVNGQLPRSVEAGARVDLWAAREGDSGLFGPPVVIVSSATVVRLIEGDSIVVNQSSGSVELLVERSRVARVLEAIANEDVLSLVPTGIPVKG
ncbi:MAG: hypothetical protein ACOH1T_02180 [Microbacteriaceae bacterium]